MKRASNHWEKLITTDVRGMFMDCLACWMGKHKVSWEALGDSGADMKVESEDIECADASSVELDECEEVGDEGDMSTGREGGSSDEDTTVTVEVTAVSR